MVVKLCIAFPAKATRYSINNPVHVLLRGKRVDFN